MNVFMISMGVALIAVALFITHDAGKLGEPELLVLASIATLGGLAMFTCGVLYDSKAEAWKQLQQAQKLYEEAK